MLDFIGRRIAVENLSNIHLFKASREDLNLPERDIDTILMSDMLHYVPDRVPLLRKLRAFLRSDGRMIVLDFTPKSMEERPWGPSPEQQFSRDTIEAEMREAGMKLSTTYDFLPEQHLTQYVRDLPDLRPRGRVWLAQSPLAAAGRCGNTLPANEFTLLPRDRAARRVVVGVPDRAQRRPDVNTPASPSVTSVHFDPLSGRDGVLLISTARGWKPSLRLPSRLGQSPSAVTGKRMCMYPDPPGEPLLGIVRSPLT
jgi:SAM-dependent methyltransferase